MLAASWIQHSLGHIAVGNIINAQTQGIQVCISAVFGSDLLLDISSRQACHKAVTGSRAVAGTVIGFAGNIAELIGCEGRCAVTHQHHNRGAVVVNSHILEQAQSFPQTALDVSTATGADGFVHILAFAVFDVSGRAKPTAAYTTGADLAGVALNVLRIATVCNRGVMIQRKQNMGVGRIQHDTHPVLFVTGQQVMNGIVGGCHHSIQLGVA